VSEPRTFEEREIFESRRSFIIKYVIDHPNCTKADVIRYMKGRSAVRTTHGILIKLIKEGKIKVQKKHIQTHLLTINDDNDFIKIYKQIDELYNFTNEASKYMHSKVALGFFAKYHKTKPPLKYEGINGLENSFRQLFNIMTQILDDQISETSRKQDASVRDADHRLLDDNIKFVYSNLSFYSWDRKTTKEVVDFCSGNIKRFFQTANKDKNKLVKMMDRDEIDKINEYTEIGDKLIQIIDKFKREYSSVYEPTRKWG
jgi:hypothetical protein